MTEIMALFEKPEFWFVTVFLSFLINIASTYLVRGLDVSVAWLQGAWGRRGMASQERVDRVARVNLALGNLRQLERVERWYPAVVSYFVVVGVAFFIGALVLGEGEPHRLAGKEDLFAFFVAPVFLFLAVLFAWGRPHRIRVIEAMRRMAREGTSSRQVQ